MTTPPAWAPPSIARPYGMVEFRAMASPCRIITDTIELAEWGRDVVDDLEQRWSRFLPDSEISRLNAAAGAVCTVSPETYRLVERAEFARVATGGRFNPFVLDRLQSLGDGVDLPLVDGVLEAQAVIDPTVILVEGASAVHIPSGARFDPGGIGKGLAGDIVAERLVAAGAASVQVELGGDVRLVGRGWRGERWTVDVREPRHRRTVIGTIELDDGAVATSSVLGRRWRRGNAEMHHIIDPSTGLPSTSDLVAVTATSSELWWAEIVAKTVLMSGSDRAAGLMETFGATGLAVSADGVVTPIGTGASRS